jgi:nucleoside-diphosphate-sugar epimerase
MNVLVTGHNGYIGSVLVPMLLAAGHRVVGLDSYLFAACLFGSDVPDVPAWWLDIRDVQPEHLAGFDAVIHLAGLSNDPLADLNPELTNEINYLASVRLARLAKEAGVSRFVFSSSCSIYGAAGDDLVTEEAPCRPLTPYGISKVKAEEKIAALADSRFSPIILRNATAYGVSPRLRGDLVVNNLVGYASTTGTVLLKSDGTAWRPLVHVADIARAFLGMLQAPRERVHNQVFNVGRTEENYRIRDVAALVREIVPGCTVGYAAGASADQRCYRVDCSKLAATLPECVPQWTVRQGIEQLYQAYRQQRLTAEEFLGPRYLRIEYIKQLLSAGYLDETLRWRAGADPQVDHVSATHVHSNNGMPFVRGAGARAVPVAGGDAAGRRAAHGGAAP